MEWLHFLLDCWLLVQSAVYTLSGLLRCFCSLNFQGIELAVMQALMQAVQRAATAAAETTKTFRDVGFLN